MDNIREKAEQPNGLREGSIFEDQVSAKAFDLLSKSIPGGIMGGYLEEGFPLYYINNHMLNELGYTYQEFVDATEGLVINSMHPEDRMRVDDAVDKAFQAGQEYEVRYRMLTKNGRYIWVKDVGKQSVDQNGRPVCISVVRNITNEVEAEERLKKENEEKEKQACRYDRLFHSVLCGIVQYQYQDGERVVFRNANQEAIRIFGYDEESFWKIKSWKFQDVVAAED